MEKEVDLTPLERALGSLEKALAAPPKNDLERDGVIQRFEFTFELAWKTMRRVLVSLGRTQVSGSPRPIIRDAATEHFIESPETWIGFLEARNQIAHSYNESVAQDVYEKAQHFPPLVRSLLKRLKNR